jgi:tetratricopeptide (TPR) repeat protein
MAILGYIVLGLSILITLGWCFNIRHKVKYQQAREKGMELQGFLMTVSIVLVFVLPLSPFHLLWMLPASFIVGLVSAATPLRILWIFSSIYFSFWYIGISNIGRKFYVDGEYEKAVAAFKEEITKKPSSAEAYYNLALAYGKLGHHDNEIAAYEGAIKLMPNKPETYFNLGTAYIDNGEKQKAIEAFKKAINLRPDYLKAHYTLCKTFAELCDKENALKELEIVKKTDSRSADELTSIINHV